MPRERGVLCHFVAPNDDSVKEDHIAIGSKFWESQSIYSIKDYTLSFPVAEEVMPFGGTFFPEKIRSP